MNLSGIYNLKERTNNFIQKDCQCTEREKFTICVITDCDTDISGRILDSYLHKGASCTEDISEMFIAVIFDKENRSVYAFSDITTSPLDLYYTVNDSKLYYSTSLKQVLSESKCERKLNIRAAREFLINGFVFGSDSLIENVYKLASGYMLAANGSDISQIHYDYKIPKFKIGNAEEELLPVMRGNIKKLTNENGEIFIPLSSGFDSNLVLDTLLDSTDRKINAFTVGGKTGRSEIETVKENVADIPQVNLNTIIIDETYFNSLTDIVWRLEGCVFEAGIFLQYALAKSLNENNAKSLICGEYADQILSCFYKDSLKRSTSNNFKKNEKFYMYADPYVTGNMIILKKSGKMLNSFGITGKYPFARNNITPVADKIKGKNGSSKKLYKEQCRSVFLPSIVKNLQKIGGATSNQAILSYEGYEKLKEKLNNSELLKSIYSNSDKPFVSMHSYKLRVRQATEWIFSDIKECGIAGGVKKTMATLQSKGMSKELKELYLLIFNELFISERFDTSFNSDSAVITTNEFLKTL